MAKGTELETRVAVLESEKATTELFFERIDSSVQKTSDVLVAVKEMLAVHEERHRRQDDTNRTLTDAFRTHTSEDSAEFEHMRKDVQLLSTTLEGKIDTVKTDIMKEFAGLKKDLGDRLTNYDKLKWTITGAGIILLVVLANIGLHIPSLSIFGGVH